VATGEARFSATKKEAMKRSMIMFGSVMVLGLLAAPALAAKCTPDSVKVGPVCVDKYEASAWQIFNADLRKQAQKGELTLADLARLPSSVAHQEVPAGTTIMSALTTAMAASVILRLPCRLPE